jgi:cytoskeletal protein RodZ
MIGRRATPSAPKDDKPKGFDDFEVRLGDVMRGERATLGRSLLDVQRELKIKATYIAAIENCDVSAFESQGFIAGYIRSYARYLGMDPDWAYAKFCAEAGFSTAHGMSSTASSPRAAKASTTHPRAGKGLRDPFADPNATFIPRGKSFMSHVEPGAVGSIIVLVTLIAAIGYGGWSVLQEVQRVQLAPVEQAPVVVAEVDPLGNVAGDAPIVRSAPEVAADAGNETLDPAADDTKVYDRLYRPQALDVPVMVSRDGPIAGIDPKRPGAGADTTMLADGSVAEAVENAVQVVEAEAPAVELLAVRPSWVRVQSADGTVLFEKVLDAGERYVVPQMEEPAVLRAGNSGSVYFAVNGQTLGPAAPGAQVVKNVALSPEALKASYQLADLSVDDDLATFVAVAENTTAEPVADPAFAAPSE